MQPQEALEPSQNYEAANRFDLSPVVNVETAIARYSQLKEYVSRVLKDKFDYGVIPGTDKKTLLKPGAEKLTTLFGLTKKLQIVDSTEDWDGTGIGNGEPLFNYVYRCSLFKGDLLIAEADGSCNSRETKYRYREGHRKCPVCNSAAIIRGKAEYGGGWLCFSKKGGCGAKFPDNAAEIEKQQTGRVPNQDIADQVNTIQKMAAKRALIAATLLACNASEFFTQDVEDFADVKADGDAQQKQSPHQARQQQAKSKQAEAQSAGENGPNKRKVAAWCKSQNLDADAESQDFLGQSFAEIDEDQAEELFTELREKLAGQRGE